MSALAPLAAPASADAGLRLFEIVGDAYEPQLRSHDRLMVAATDRFHYDTEYLLDFGHGEAPYRATSHGDRIHVCHPNPTYSRFHVERADFNRAVTAIVVAEVKVKNERLILQAHAKWVTS